MKENNDRFLESYNRLDSFLQGLVKTSGHVTMISYLERILPEKKHSELKTIRQHRNNVEHGVPPGSKKPVVPEAWITFLSQELDWCKRNAKSIAPKLQKMLNSSNKSKTVYHSNRNSRYHNNGFDNTASFNPTQAFVVSIVTPKGRELYFGGFKREVVKTGFLKLKKESFEYEDNVRNIYDAKTYSTKGAADFMADKLRKKHPKCHISVLKI